jgi:hypothetical protein
MPIQTANHQDDELHESSQGSSRTEEPKRTTRVLTPSVLPLPLPLLLLLLLPLFLAPPLFLCTGISSDCSVLTVLQGSPSQAVALGYLYVRYGLDAPKLW